MHGVGGTTGAALLGLDDENEPVLVAQGGRTFFWRRPTEPRIEGYVWGGLTSGSRLQPLWILLLPFTLLNVAGWMHEPKGVIAGWRVRAIRYLTFALGLTLTATYIVWITAILVDDLGYTWLPRRYGWEPRRGVLAGLGVAVVIVAAAAWMARRTRGGEKYTAQAGPQTLSASRGGLLGVGGNDEDDSLMRAGFFNRSQDSNRLLALHCAVAFGVLAALAVAAYTTGAHTPSKHHLADYLEHVFFVIGVAQFAGLVLLFVASVSRKPTGFHIAGPAVAAALAIAIANALLAGAARAVDKTVKIEPGGEFMFADVMVVTLLVLLLVVLVWIVDFKILPGPLGEVTDVPHNTAAPGTPANGATDSMRRKTATFRGLTNGLNSFDEILTIAAVAFVGLAAATGLARRHHPHAWRVPLLATSGTQLIAWGGVGLILLLWTKRNDPRTRKKIGIVWDLLTFWPRRFHPFAIRPYSAQAVAELRGRINALATEGRVVLSTHSQGTVLALAAIAPLVDRRGVIQRVSLVTFGSPIGGLYSTAFPAYFNGELTTVVNMELHDWVNYRRLTDPIGHDIKGVATAVLQSPGVTPDPLPDQPLRVPATRAERDRLPWIDVVTHSYYRNEPRLKRVIDELRYS